MKKEIIEANKALVHNVRNDLLHLKLLQRRLRVVSLDIEKALYVYRETIDNLVNDNEDKLSDGKNSKNE